MTGDFVVIINAAKLRFTGRKLTRKEYYFHSGYPGGLRIFTLERMMQRSPARVVEIAVKGMLPKSTLGVRMLKRLKVYAGETHPHQAQIKGYGAPASGLSELGSPQGHGGEAQ
jgi:large subunit ribosomal protein L13